MTTTATQSHLSEILRLITAEKQALDEDDMMTRQSLTQMESIGLLVQIRRSPQVQEISLDLIGHRHAVEQCVQAVCNLRHVLREELLGRVRHEKILVERHLFFWLTRELRISSMTTARVTGFDHATILHGARAYQDRIDTDPIYRAIADNVLNRLIPKAAGTVPHGRNAELSDRP